MPRRPLRRPPARPRLSRAPRARPSRRSPGWPPRSPHRPWSIPRRRAATTRCQGPAPPATCASSPPSVARPYTTAHQPFDPALARWKTAAVRRPLVYAVTRRGRGMSEDQRAPDATPAGSAEAGAGALAARFPVFGQEALYKRIAAHVRELIETKQLQPGERLPAERDLARMLGVSRVPIREGMRTLAAQGLIDIRRGQGMFVASNAVDATVEELTSALLKQRDLLAEL